MKKGILSFVFLASVVFGARAATVGSVTASQQWPWSTDVKVTYVLSDVSAPVDITVSANNGGTVLPIPAKAMKGDIYGISTSGNKTIVIDPIVAFGTAQAALTDLTITLAANDSPSEMTEAIYRIFDLNDGTHQDVTRAAILNGEWGAYETSYAAFDPDFRTDLDDVLIWTDVTNNPAYKTDKLVMRRIKAKNVVWQSGDPSNATHSNSDLTPQNWVKLTYDYFISIFETTQAQYKKIYGSLYGTECKYTDDPDSPSYPVNGTYRYYVYAHPGNGGTWNGVLSNEPIVFPTNTYVREVGGNTVCAKLWTKTGYEFNLPTGAEWEFACRGGNSTVLYTGESQTEAHIAKIAWYSANGGGKPHVVGSKPPNAYGLYDMLGNVMEHCNYKGNLSQGGISGTGASEEDPVVNPLGATNTTKDTHYWSVGYPCFEVDYGYFSRWMDGRAAARSGSFEWWAQRPFLGFRLVCPVTKKWGADWPNTILEE